MTTFDTDLVGRWFSFLLDPADLGDAAHLLDPGDPGDPGDFGDPADFGEHDRGDDDRTETSGIGGTRDHLATGHQTRHHDQPTRPTRSSTGPPRASVRATGPVATGAEWGIRPTAAERRVLLQGRDAIAAAVGWSGMPGPAEAPADSAAAGLAAYLGGLATGIAGTRRAMLDAGPAEVALADRLSLVAGLIAGGAALQVVPDDAIGSAAGDGPTATDLARVAGTSAAELVVDGADLHTITTAAAAAAMVSGPPDGANRSPRYRTRALVALVLMALQRSTAPPGDPVEPPSCGARPGVNNGAELLAEVTFTCFLSDADSARLERTLDGVAAEVVVWSEGDRRYFHVHSRAAGEVVAQAYAVGPVFALEIGRL